MEDVIQLVSIFIESDIFVSIIYFVASEIDEWQLMLLSFSLTDNTWTWWYCIKLVIV